MKKLERAQIDVNLSWLEKRLGKHLTNAEMQGKLEQLGFDVEIDGDNMHVTAPTWRSTGDISIKDDVMEEVARMYGYDNFEATEFTTTFTSDINQKDKSLVRNIKEYLAFRCGMQEVYTYPWMNDVFVNAVLKNTDGILRLSTPPAPDMSYIRSSLLPNLCEAVAKNERYFTDFSIFEEAQVFFDRNYTSVYDETESLPEQRQTYRRGLRQQREGYQYPLPGGEGRPGADAPLHPYGSVRVPQRGETGVGGQYRLAESLPRGSEDRRHGPCCKESVYGVRHQEPLRHALRAGRHEAETAEIQN